jgi:hypothetical protein
MYEITARKCRSAPSGYSHAEEIVGKQQMRSRALRNGFLNFLYIKVVVIDDNLAREVFPGQDPMGRRIARQHGEVTAAGVGPPLGL